MLKKRVIILLLLLSALLLYLFSPKIYNVFMQAVYPLRYEEYILDSSEEYGLDKYLVMALIKTESNYIYDAHSGIARGLMQITDSTAEWIADKLNIDFSPEDIENPQLNIRMGCFYLNYLIEHYGNVQPALAAYNAGMGNVSRWLNDDTYSVDGETLHYIPFAETSEYLKKIEKYVEIYKKLY